MKDNILKITKKNQLKSLFPFFIIFFGYILCILIMINYNSLFTKIGLLGVILLSYPVIPAIFLHIEYYIRNRGEEYELLGDRIVRYKKGIKTEYKKEDIEDIYIIYSRNYNRGSSTGFEGYHFARVLLKSGKELYLTSLLYPDGIGGAFYMYLRGISHRIITRKLLFCTTLYKEEKQRDEGDYYGLFKNDKK
jgi:hypothetical protein